MQAYNIDGRSIIRSQDWKNKVATAKESGLVHWVRRSQPNSFYYMYANGTVLSIDNAGNEHTARYNLNKDPKSYTLEQIRALGWD